MLQKVFSQPAFLVYAGQAENAASASQRSCKFHGPLQTPGMPQSAAARVLSEQIVPSSFAFALDCLFDHELDLMAMGAKFNDDEVGASAYGSRAILKRVVLACSHGRIPQARIVECDHGDGRKAYWVGTHMDSVA